MLIDLSAKELEMLTTALSSIIDEHLIHEGAEQHALLARLEANGAFEQKLEDLKAQDSALQSEEKAIQFFYYYDAPEWMREACSQGGDEDWIAVFPVGHHEAPKPGDRDVFCPYFRDCCSIDAVQLADGRMALVGTHA